MEVIQTADGITSVEFNYMQPNLKSRFMLIFSLH